MGQLMCQDFPTTRTTRVALPLAKEDILSDGKSAGVKRMVERIGIGAGMYHRMPGSSQPGDEL